MRRWLLLGFLAGCDLVFELKDPGEGFSRTITIDQTSGMTHENFPVSVLLENDPALLAHAATDGSDILFTGSDGTELNAEVSYDGVTGTLDAWVQIPSLPSSPSQIQLRYGGRQRTVVASATWSNSYLGVWHFSEDSGGVAAESVAGANAVAVNTAIPEIDVGLVGRGRVFNGIDHVMCTFDPLFANFDAASGFSIGVWILAGLLGPVRQPVSKGSGGMLPGYRIEFDATRISAIIGDGSTNALATDPGAPPVGSWVQLRASINRPAMELKLHVNGQFKAVADITSLGSLENPNLTLCFGDPGEKFMGTLDEVRIYNGTQSDQWIFAEYDNLTNRSGFITIEEEIVL